LPPVSHLLPPFPNWVSSHTSRELSRGGMGKWKEASQEPHTEAFQPIAASVPNLTWALTVVMSG
jgi:hypothetical protein